MEGGHFVPSLEEHSHLKPNLNRVKHNINKVKVQAA